MIIIRVAEQEDIPSIKDIADKFRYEVSFIPRSFFERLIAKGWVYVADLDGRVVGFVATWQRRDGWTTVHHICVLPQFQGRGIGRALLESVPRPLRLRCPENLSANGFYEHIGLRLLTVENGKYRKLCVWVSEN